jgi:hypothetical protein
MANGVLCRSKSYDSNEQQHDTQYFHTTSGFPESLTDRSGRGRIDRIRVAERTGLSGFQCG